MKKKIKLLPLLPLLFLFFIVFRLIIFSFQELKKQNKMLSDLTNELLFLPVKNNKGVTRQKIIQEIQKYLENRESYNDNFYSSLKHFFGIYYLKILFNLIFLVTVCIFLYYWTKKQNK